MVGTSLALVMGMVSIAEALISGGFKMAGNAAARKESRGLAEIVRKDTLGKLARDNSLTRQSLLLNDRKLQHSEEMANMDIAEMEKQKSYITGVANQTNRENIAGSLLGPQSRLGGNKRRFI